MRMLLVVLSVLSSWQLPAQVDTAVSLLPKQMPPIVLAPSVAIGDTAVVLRSSISPMYKVPTYLYQQGKLPMFCAMEDRFWRKVGIGFQFRLADGLLVR